MDDYAQNITGRARIITGTASRNNELGGKRKEGVLSTLFNLHLLQVHVLILSNNKFNLCS